jgi:hypothetical protein
MALNKNIAALIAQAAGLDDQNERVTGPEFTLPPEGITVGRFVEYVEIGMHPQKPFKGKEKPDAEMVYMKFDLVGPKNLREHEGQKFCDQISIRVKLSKNDKAGYVALYDKMKYGRDKITHMAQMLGEAFIITVVHNKGDGEGARTYANMKTAGAAGVWQIGAPVVTDPLTGVATKVPVPAALSEIKFFGWNVPTQETWDSLFIDGERELDDGKGGKTVKSKNWIQELILSATNFEGSPLHQLLGGVDGLNLPTEEEEAVEEVSEETTEEPPFEVDALAEEVAEEDTTEEAPAEEDEIAALKAQLAALQGVKKAPPKAVAKPATKVAPKEAPAKGAAPAKAAAKAQAKAPATPAKAAAKPAGKPAAAPKPAATDTAAALAALGLTE